jgi:hypothetical protein
LRIAIAALRPVCPVRALLIFTPPLLGIELCGKPTRPGAFENDRRPATKQSAGAGAGGNIDDDARS